MRVLENNIVKELVRVLGPDADLHIVGGAIRDALLNVEAHDLDFATRLHPREMIARFQSNGIKFIETGIRRGTITALIDGEPVEVTTFRNYENENTFTETIEEDLSARDLTINAIAINVHTGKVVDPFNGQADLEEGVLRTVGEAVKRFEEDPHRIIRLVRFAAKLGFVIHPATQKAAVASRFLLEDVAIERIEAELVKILTIEDGHKVAFAIGLLEELGILEIFIPELSECVGVEQNHFHIFDVFGHILSVLKNSPNILSVRLAALLHDVAKPRTITVGDDGVRHFLTHEDVGAELAKEILQRLKFPADLTRNVCKLISEHMRPINVGPRGARRLIKEVGELLPEWIELKKADKLGGRPEKSAEIFEAKWKKFLSVIEAEQNRKDTHPFETLAINGRDVLDAGVKEGPEVGRILGELMELVLDTPEFNTREKLLVELERRA